MDRELKILLVKLMAEYLAAFDQVKKRASKKLQYSDLRIDAFSFYILMIAVFLSKIERESIELDSFIKHKRFGIKYQFDFKRNIDYLYNACLFAQQNRLIPKSVIVDHTSLTKHILQKS